MSPRVIALCLFLGVFAQANETWANEIFVKTVADTLSNDDLCSLREALINANTNQMTWSDCDRGSDVDVDEIRFDGALATRTIELQSPLPAIEGPTSVIGPAGEGQAIILDGGEAFSLISTGESPFLHLQNLVLTRGAGQRGAAIDAPNALELIIERCRIVDNSTTAGPVISINRNLGGAASFTMADSTVRGNRNSSQGASGKVLRIDQGVARIERSEISDNSATGDLGVGTLYVNESELVVINSTISGNRLGGGAGGAAIYLRNSAVDLVHATIVDNRSLIPTAKAVFANASGGGSASLTIVNSLLLPDSGGSAVCGSLNAQWFESSSFSSDPNCLQSSPPVSVEEVRLLPLDDNGGLTRTHALEPRSVAIDAAGDCANIDPSLDVDQRSEPRPGVNSSDCDAGAYEAALPINDIFRDRFAQLSHNNTRKEVRREVYGKANESI
jgi:CSLREA domain-containing protein